MKKIILWILSILLISPVFAEDIRSVSYNNQISFEEINTNTNVTYIQKWQNSISCNSIPSLCARTYFWLYDIDNIFATPSSFYISSNTWYWYNVNLTYSFIQLSNDKFNIIDSSRLGGYGVIGINYSWYNYDIDSLQVFYSRPEDTNYSWNNPLISFWNNVLTWNYKILNNNYVRVFYNDNEFNWYNFGTAPWINEEKNTPFNYQIFTLWSSYFNTKNYNVKLPDRVLGTFYTPSISYWFSFINALTWYTWSSLKFYSVFPYFDYEFTWWLVYNLPSWSYTDKFYVFRYDWLRAWSSIYYIGVLSKCNARFCDGTWIYSDLLYSEYYCNWLWFNTWSKKIDFSSCTLINWWVVKNILPFSNSSSVVNISFVTNDFLNNILDVFNSPSLTYWHNFTFPHHYWWNWFWNFYINDRNQLCYKVDSYPSYYYNWEYNWCYTIDFTSTIPDILNWFDNTAFPPEPLTPEESRDRAYDIICKLSPNNPICLEFGYTTWAYDVSFTADWSWWLLATITLYDEDDWSCPDIYFTWSDWVYYHQYFDRVCYNVAMIPFDDSTPNEDITSALTWLETSINLAFSDILSWKNFKFYSCPFNSPLRALNLSSIGWLSSFLLDKFFDVNLVWPFNCLLGWILYSETDSMSLWSKLLLNSYNWEKFFNSFSDDVKKTINWLLFALMILFFWFFRPKEH